MLLSAYFLRARFLFKKKIEINFSVENVSPASRMFLFFSNVIEMFLYYIYLSK